MYAIRSWDRYTRFIIKIRKKNYYKNAFSRRNQRTDRKKKKTVSFIMNQDIANIIHQSGTMTKKDSILKVSIQNELVSVL